MAVVEINTDSSVMENRVPKFSVIVPAYNAEKYLERCLNSLAIQTFNNFEIIFINDGSIDKTIELVQRFKGLHPKIPIHIFSQNNRGVSSARNTGVSKAVGEWVLFLDADDELPNNALETYSKFITPNLDMLIGGYVVSNINREITYSIPERVEMQLDREAAIKLMYTPVFYRYLGYIASKCYRLSNIKKWKLAFNPNIYFNEDRLFTTRYLCKSDKVLFFTSPVYNYFEHAESAMASLQEQFNPKFITDLKGFVEMKKSIRKSKGSKELLKLADQGILSSYQRIKGQLNSYHKNTIYCLLYLQALLLNGLGLCKYVQFLSGVLFAKVSK